MFHTFKNDFLYHHHIDDCEKVNEYIINCMQEVTGGEGVCWDLSSVKTSFFEGNNDFLMDDFVLDEIIWKPLDVMLSENDNEIPFGPDTPVHSVVNGIWYNIYREGEYQEIHSHEANTRDIDGAIYHPNFSFIYLVELPPGIKNTTVFTKSQKIMGNVSNRRDNIDTSKMEDVRAGSVLIFPSHLDHYVVPFYGEGRRITVAANVLTSYST